MAERYQVHWAAVAEADLAAIIETVAERSLVSATRLLDALEHRAATLRASPLRGLVVPELARFEIRDYRELLEGHHRIVYAVRDRQVHVVAIVDDRRDLAAALLARLIR